MPSPFPGMDPYIESSGYWKEFHTTLLTAIRAQLNARLPPRYRAHMDIYATFQGPEVGVRWRRIEPDVLVRERPGWEKPPAGAAAEAAPATIVLPEVERETIKSVLLIDREESRIVTVIEVLSPSNKRAGDDRQSYLHKRGHCLANRISLVEIDLLRGGTRLPLGDPPPRGADYYVMACRAWEYPRAGLWTFSLRDPLPDVPVPLAADVSAVALGLKPCADRAYDEGSYDTELPYDEPLTPRARKADALWVKSVLARRPRKTR